jgi:GDP-4-dehydro-6-deoxy-D-mannose reductase
MRALITGANGFAGTHLTRHLRERGDSVFGLVLPGGGGDGRLGPDVEPLEADIRDAGAVARAIEASRPEVIFHLAAFSNPEQSRNHSRETLETNILGAQNLLDAALGAGGSLRVLLVGSTQQYGLVPEQEQPITEDRVQRPQSPYAVSKAAQELLGLSYFLSEELPVFLVRPFNHTGPGQDSSYVCSNFARQIAEIEAGRREPRILVGNLAARRDFTDVRDVVRAYVAVIERGAPGRPYNVCSGEARPVGEILDILLGLARCRVSVEQDRTRHHAMDVPLLRGSNRRLREEVGWKPALTLERTLQDLLDDWREREGP